MTGEELIGFWPEAAMADRPKNLFVDYTVTAEENAVLEGRGWCLWDIRRLPNKTDADRAEGVKCLLEGIRVGSISPDKEKMRWLELEAKVYGLLTGKDKLAGKAPKVDQEVLDNLLDFGKKQAKIR
jgi:hypothetical protein|tara:strand:- start:2065 stop:2442 length:378 start_codon:yes stop_codon:yes gene_type:complete